MRFNDRSMALLGIPDLPADAFKKEGGKIKLHGGGGGSQPRETVQTQTTIPEYARPYVEKMLGKAEAATSAPYQAYGGQRTADFTPLQQQAFKGAENLGPAGQIGAGTQFAGVAGLQGLGAGQQYAQQATSPGSMQAYMSPYTQLALEPQMREAARRSAMEGQAQQAMAAQRGAFGGSRSGLIEAERQRNLGQLQSDIYGKGMQTAFEQARQAQQFGADLGLRGAGLGLQAAGQLGQLGQTQFGQEEAAMRAKGAAGAQQQARQQQIMTQDYQDFLDEKNYEKQQLSFLSDILRGVPLSQSSYQTYQAPPSFASQAAQFGAGAYGLSQLGKGGFFNEGGEVKRYAEGGIAMAAGGTPYDMSIDKLRADLKGMSDEQLQTIGGNTKNAITLGVVGAEMDRRRAMEDSMILARSVPEGTVQEAMMGIDEAPLDPRMFADTAVGEVEPAPRQEPQAEEMARGGIVAFAKGNKVEAKPDYVSQYAALDPSTAFATPQARLQASEEGFKRYKEFMGADEVETATKDLMKGLEVTPEQRAMQRAGLAFAIASKFGRPGKVFSEEAGEAGGVIAEKTAEVEKLDREIKRQQGLMNLDLKKTQRAEKKGQWDMMEKYGEKADARAATLYGLEADKSKAMAETQLKREQMANQLEQARISAGPGYAAANKPTDFRTAQSAYINKAMADFKAKNPGRGPSEQEFAEMNQKATEDAGNLMKQYSGQLNKEKLEDTRRNKAYELALKELDTIPGLNKEFRRIAKETGVSQQQVQEQWLEKRIKKHMEKESAGDAGGAGGAGGRLSLEEFLAKARPANPNASDADLISYYNRTYAQ
jgi:hypothetical protein